MPARAPTAETDPAYTAGGATDAELAAAIAAHAAGDATDAELAAALVAVSAEIDSDVAAAVAALNASAAAHAADETDVHGIDNTDLLVARADLRKGLFHAKVATGANYSNGAEVVFDSELLDLDGWYDPATGRFTPQMAGYWDLSWQFGLSITAGAVVWSQLLKNGAAVPGGGGTVVANNFASTQTAYTTGFVPVLLNGSTDFASVRLFTNSGSQPRAIAATDFSHFEAELIGRST